MFKQNYNIRIGALLVYLLLPVTCLFASTESYMQALSGKIKKGDSCTVVDDKFSTFSVAEWNRIQNLSVDNIISFELRRDTAFYLHKPFTCTLNLTIKYYTSKDQVSPDVLKDITLNVNFDSASGKSYVSLSQYKFRNAYKVVVTVDSIYSKEWGNELPNIFRIKNQILVERKYPFEPAFPVPMTIQGTSTSVSHRNDESAAPDGYTQQSFGGPTAEASWDHENPPAPFSTKINVSWSPMANYEEYDFEWTYIDAMSEIGRLITSSGIDNITTAQREEWMRNNNTRVTVNSLTYSINLPYSDGYVLFRVRGVTYQAAPGTLRLTSAWNNDVNNKFIVQIDAHQPSLNWQYSGSFAEEGKRKEVVSYFDATLRNRQTVTINNSDAKAVIAETIYDNMGRPAMNILPAPTNSSLLGFYPAFNKSFTTGNAYSHAEIKSIGCSIKADSMSTVSGASQYYSPANTFKDDPNFYFSKYVPDAEKYPFSVTEYTPDNTGRIRRQGGVGRTFQIGNGRETKYYYGKPSQKELDRLFGMEVGDASHYLKNMVVDPNGQISVSYMDNNGKTIATALAGETPSNVDALPSAATASTTLNQALISPKGFTVDASNLFMQASATFLAAVTGNYTLHYSVDPLQLTQTKNTSNFCTTCFYNVLIEVRDDCGDLVGSAASTPFLGGDVSCTNTATITSNLPLTISKIGEYTVSYTLRMSKEVMKQQEDYYIANNTALTKLQTFLTSELYASDLAGCYTECKTCVEKLGTPTDFANTMKQLFVQLNNEKYNGSIDFGTDFAATPTLTTWITETYQSLLAKCNAAVANCYESPCAANLSLLKNDVLPGGQYALYNESFQILEPAISVLSHYRDPEIQSTPFTDEDGSSKHISDLTTDEAFIKAYLKHPEWADLFVKFHIEYCAYQWCQEHTPVYGFEQQVKDVTKATDAITRQWFSTDLSQYYKLLDADAFFHTGGAPNAYYAPMKNDLEHLSDVLHFAVYDASNALLPGKNIRQLVDWLLYCKPATLSGNTAVDGPAIAASWINCTVATDCRSMGQEWELYKNYYFQLRSKYVAQERAVTNPNCSNCFIATDNTPVVASCSSLSFSVDNLGTNSFNVNVLGLQSGDTYDISLDGGTNYPYMGLNSVTTVINMLNASTSYQVMIRRHCAAAGLVSYSGVVPITTLTPAPVNVYQLRQVNDCNGYGVSTVEVKGKAGDLVTIKLQFSGTIKWNEWHGLYFSAESKLESTVNGQFLSEYKATPAYDGLSEEPFDLVSEITFIMPSSPVLLTTVCNVHNSVLGLPRTGVVSIKTVNGVANGTQIVVCSANTGGAVASPGQ